MRINQYNYNLRRPEPVEVPDAPIHDFVRWIMETDKWRDDPETTFERVMRLRKRLMALKQPVAPAAPPVIVPDEA